MDLTGNRRIIALTEALAALVWISILAVAAPATATGVLIITGGAVATMLSVYLGADGFIKSKQSGSSTMIMTDQGTQTTTSGSTQQ